MKKILCLLIAVATLSPFTKGQSSLVPPTIKTSPIDQTTALSGTVIFTATVTGAVSYQWQLLFGTSWILLPSSNNDPNTASWSSSSNIPQLSVTPFIAAWSGMQFRLVATAANGTIAYSSPATLTILSITSPPTNQSTVLNGTDIFTATVAGKASYLWQFSYDLNNWFSIPSADGSYTDPNGKWLNMRTTQLSVTPFTKAWDGIHWRLVATASNGTTVTSNPVTLTLMQITAQPFDWTVEGTHTAYFFATVANAASYQWQYSTNLINWSFSPLADGTYADAKGKWSDSRTSQLSINPIGPGWNGLHWRLISFATNGTSDTTSTATLHFIPATGPSGSNQSIVQSTNELAGLYAPLASPSVYPNPTSNLLHIDNLVVGSQVTLFDILGNKTGLDILATSNSQTFNIGTSAPGIYLLRITSPDGKISTVKIVKK